VLGVVLLTLGFVHVPLPQPDFHNIRHHDKPGEVCERHDHLLRWHPGAGVARDVAVLHWHWVLPSAEGDPSNPPDGSKAALHAHNFDWPSGSWDEAPQVAPDRSSVRADLRPAPQPFGPFLAAVAPDVAAVGRDPSSARCAPLAPGVSLNAMLHRWDC
jgi:hypothetical protein